MDSTAKYPPQVIIDTLVNNKFRNEGLPELTLEQTVMIEQTKIQKSIRNYLKAIFWIIVIGIGVAVLQGCWGMLAAVR